VRAKTIKKAWDTLQQKFEGDLKVIIVKLQYLKRDLENEKEKENLNEYFNRLSELMNQIKSHKNKSRTCQSWFFKGFMGHLDHMRKYWYDLLKS